MTRGDALERIGDERARLPLCIRASLLVELSHGSRKLVPDEVLGSLEQLRACLGERQPADALELPQHLVAAGLELLLKLLGMSLAIGNALLAARELLALGLDLGLVLLHARLGLCHLHA